jgi:hypothetical protein
VELRDPVAVYNAASNVEVQLVKLFLNEAGLDAFASEDLSTAGLWMFGMLPEIHKPQVWVSAQDKQRAETLLQDYERHVAERRELDRSRPAPSPSPAIEVLCEECNERSNFPADQYGTVQDCPRCGAYVDVGEADIDDPFWL